MVNVDRIFSSPLAYRTYIGGDNYGMGVSAGRYIGQTLKDKGVANPVIAEIQGIASLPLTVDRSKGFADALEDVRVQGQQPGVGRVHRRLRRGGDGATCCRRHRKIDAIWNHDDDQGVGVLAAIQNAGRDEFFMVGGAGSANVMRDIKADNTVLKATVIYPSTQSASGILLARLLVLGKGMSRPEGAGGAEVASPCTRRSSPRTTSTRTCRWRSSPELRVIPPRSPPAGRGTRSGIGWAGAGPPVLQREMHR